MLGKIIIYIFIAAIVFNLFRGLYFLVKKPDRESKDVVRALSWRIGLSTFLFVLILVMNYFGLVELHSLPVKPSE